jgi:hypothetical protein
MVFVKILPVTLQTKIHNVPTQECYVSIVFAPYVRQKAR